MESERARGWILTGHRVSGNRSYYSYQCEGERITITKDHATGTVKTSGHPAPMGLLFRHMGRTL